VLLVSLGHLLVHEIVQGFRRGGHSCEVLFIPGEAVELARIEQMFQQALRTVKPDFLLTVNHRGFDQEGYITRMLERCRIPFASWYVDSPQLILGHYRENNSPFLTLFFWDREYCPMFRNMGFERVAYLPLGVDEALFAHGAKPAGTGKFFPMPVSFVGNSLFYKAGLRLAKSAVAGPLKEQFFEVAEAFLDSPHLVVRDLLDARFPELSAHFQELNEPRALSYETAITWQATGIYRLSRLRRLEGFPVTVAGDPGWASLLNNNGFSVRRELNYYKDLPGFYGASRVCFNATSRQMKQGLNQRVFDVPAAGSVLLTDWTEQLAELMEPGKEVLAYKSPEEIPGLVDRALKDQQFFEDIRTAGHHRAVSEHTYCIRCSRIVEVMRAAFA
jgi:spore maturation protein CgeB